MKDYITITDKNNTARKVEVVATFTLDEFDYNYIVYKELDGSHNYIARYKGEDIVSLDTDLSERELNLANIIFKVVK